MRNHTLAGRVLRAFLALLLLVPLFAYVAPSPAAAASGYSLDFIAAKASTYDHTTGGGRYNQRVIGTDVVESLEGGDFSCGDIVTFLIAIERSGGSGPQTVELDVSFTDYSTGQQGAAFSDIVSVSVNGVDDTGTRGSADSVANLSSETKTGPDFTKPTMLLGSIDVTNVDPGDQVILRVDARLACDPGNNPTGNLQGALDDAYVSGESVSPGQQTIPLKQVGQIHVSSPSMTVDKTSVTTALSTPGTVPYSYLVYNNGDLELTGISLSDDNDNNDLSCPFTTLAPAASMTCTATHTFTQTELDANGSPAAGSGVLHNTVTASSNETDPVTDSLSIPIIQRPSITVVKSSKTLSLSAPGTVTYDYLVTNTGNVTITGLSLSDDNDNNDLVCDSSTIAVGGSTTCSATHTFTQAELDANGSPTAGSGVLFNNVTASSNEAPDATDFLSIPISVIPALSLVKTASPVTYASVGDVVGYSFLVTNTGNVSLAGPVTVTDDKATDESCPAVSTVGNKDGFLDPGEFITCSASYTITQADLNAGSVTNVAFASADGADSPTDTATVTAVAGPALVLVKSADPLSYDTVGDVIDYSFVLTNSGNVTLNSPFTVTDDKAIDESCPATPTSLVPGASITCSATYTITQADLDAGLVTNIARGHGFFGEQAVDSNEDTATVTASTGPALVLVKSADPLSYDTVGDVIDYSFVLTNSGNVTLNSPFTVTDDKAIDESCPATPTSLVPGASITCSATYTITQADLDNGSVTNIARGHGFFGEQAVDSNEDTATVTASTGPALVLVKTASPTTYTAAGQTITYSYEVTNTGNVTVFSLDVIDDHPITGLSCGATSLAPTESTTCTASYETTQADVTARSVTNVAHAEGFYGGEDSVLSNEDTATVTLRTPPVSPRIDLSLVKTDVADPVTLGQNVTYNLEVANAGPDTATGVVVTDTLPADTTFVSASATQGSCSQAGGTVTCNLGTLGVGATATITVTVTPQKAGIITNGAAVVGDQTDTNPGNNSDDEDTEIVAVSPTSVTVGPTTETLPFTGASSTGMGGIGAALLMLGGLVLLAFRRKDDPVVETGVVNRLSRYHV